MNSNSHLSESLSFATADEDHLIKLTEQHPWCSIAQLYLLNHYKKINSNKFEEQAEKTAIFFRNTNWLKWQLHLLSATNNKKEKEENSLVSNNEKAPDENIKKVLSEISFQEKPKEQTIAFEPLHTVDYFASQGIKITEEAVTSDKLANQMKSFTEWLKSMKKIHSENLSPNNHGDEQTDKKIQRIAEGSNSDAAIVTEAMADVLLKQNKTEKAIEVFEKLSLINPSKNAYFAAKINKLKAT